MFVISIILIALAIVWIFFAHVKIGPNDLSSYQELIQEHANRRSHSALAKTSLNQSRQGIQKDLWDAGKTGNVCSHLTSARSELFLSQNGGEIDLVEQLQDIQGWTTKGARIHTFQADSGTFDLSQKYLKANNLHTCSETLKSRSAWADFKDGALSCHALQIDHSAGQLIAGKGKLTKLNYISLESPNVDSAHASKQLYSAIFEDGVQFHSAQKNCSISSQCAFIEGPIQSLPSQKIQFHTNVEIQISESVCAQGGSAVIREKALKLIPTSSNPWCTLFRGENRVEAKEMHFDMEAKELLCLSVHGHLEEGSYFSADIAHAVFIGEALEPSILHLEGNVQIISRAKQHERRALADAATFYITQKKAVLQSAPHSRVLVWQEGLKVSAPTVHIQEAVQGFGNVRFFFNSEEQKKIHGFINSEPPCQTIRGKKCRQ